MAVMGSHNNPAVLDGVEELIGVRLTKKEEPEAALSQEHRMPPPLPEAKSLGYATTPAQELEEPGAAVCLAKVKPEVVRFLWHPRIPLGKLTILEGDPGQGKSFITAALAAAVSRGAGLPGTGQIQPGNVLLFTAEDGLGDTVRPRVEAMGGDLYRIYAHAGLVSIADSQGLAEIENFVARHRPQLVTFDPITAYLGARMDAHRANEVRAVLAPLAQLAERYECAVLIVRHLAKSASSRAIHRGLGSIDFSAAARSVLLAGSRPGEPPMHALVHMKCNVGKMAPSLGYEIREEAGQVSLRWTGESSLTANDILAAEAPREDSGRIENARSFLREALEGGPVPVEDLRRLAEKEGHSWRTVEEAKSREGVLSKREGFGKGSRFVWELASNARVPGESRP